VHWKDSGILLSALGAETQMHMLSALVLIYVALMSY
jgi:hypothetical protein